MGDTAIWNKGVAYGVIDNNTFTHNGVYPFKNDPQIADSYNWWSLSPQKDYQLGSNKSMYFEDNIINLSSGSDNACAEGQYGGRYIFRYNTINTTVASYSFFEQHGHQTSGDMPSCFGAEIYGNDITATNDDLILYKTRGGSSVVFANSGSNVSGQWEIDAYTSLVTCPEDDPNGQMVHDTYQWANRQDYSGALATTEASGDIDGCGDYDNRVTEGRDIVGPDSTPAVTYGTLANRPAEPCTEHAGYWATTQDLSNLTNFVGDNPTTPLSGTLYKCNGANVWEELFTPYTYPHPLRGEGSSPSVVYGYIKNASNVNNIRRLHPKI